MPAQLRVSLKTLHRHWLQCQAPVTLMFQGSRKTYPQVLPLLHWHSQSAGLGSCHILGTLPKSLNPPPLSLARASALLRAWLEALRWRLQLNHQMHLHLRQRGENPRSTSIHARRKMVAAASLLPMLRPLQQRYQLAKLPRLWKSSTAPISIPTALCCQLHRLWQVLLLPHITTNVCHFLTYAILLWTPVPINKHHSPLPPFLKWGPPPLCPQRPLLTRSHIKLLPYRCCFSRSSCCCACCTRPARHRC